MSNVSLVDPPVPQAIVLVIAPALIGAVFSWALYGILVVQLYLYYLSFPRDRLSIKITVYGLFLIDTFQNAVCVEAAWFYLVSGWGRPIALESFSFGFRIIPPICGVVSLWVQGFYMWRILVLGKGKLGWLVIITFIALVSLMQAIASLYVGVKLFGFTTLAQWHILEWPIGIWNVGSVLADVTIAASMVYLLWDARQETTMARNNETQNYLNRLIRNTVETGAVTAATVLIDTGVIYGLPNTTIFLVLSMMQSKVYTNSLMATLNSRSRILRQGDTEIASTPTRFVTMPRTQQASGFNHSTKPNFLEPDRSTGSIAMIDIPGHSQDKSHDYTNFDRA